MASSPLLDDPSTLMEVPGACNADSAAPAGVMFLSLPTACLGL